MTPTPLLFVGDSPDLQTGLGRIGRDLAVRCCSLPEYRVGYFGRGGLGSRQLPFTQYNFDERHQWGEMLLERCWQDFAGESKGIIFTIWDATRLTWFGNPQGLPEQMQKFLTSGRFKRWGYFPVDATGPNDRLTVLAQAALHGYDRILGYGAWGAGVLSRTTGREVDWIPHGINLDVFRPMPNAKEAAGHSKDVTLIGCVMTNQARKDWGLTAALCQRLKFMVPNLRLWFHTDVWERHWSLRALLHDFGLNDITTVTFDGSFNDAQLALAYSACDLTILPTLGEGFGLPVIESLACGVPCITGNYGGSVELVPRKEWLIDPMTWRLETLHNCVRPVYKPEFFAERVKDVLLDRNWTVEECRASIEHLDWKNLWPGAWRKFFLNEL